MLLAASLAGLNACSSEDANGTYNISDADNEMRFATGVVAGKVTRAVTRAYDTDSYRFLPLSQGTKVHVKVEGLWSGKTPESISRYTSTGTVGEPQESKSPVTGVGIYWDDYGIGDPSNETNRTNGVNVYAACVDGKAAAAIGNISNWESLEWTLLADMSTWQDKDLLISNNNSDNGKTNATGINKDVSGRFTFDKQKDGGACNLEFHHAMSKITVNLKAGKGFPVKDGKAYFEKSPSVTLSNVKLSGSVNVTTMTAIASGAATTANLTTASEVTENYTATLEGLVFPGNVISSATDKIAIINCDGNIFNIYAKELLDAMKAADGDGVYRSGKNYVVNITVDKTEIKVTATVVEWVNVTAETIEPKIEVTTSLGDKGVTGEGFTQFDFYMRKDGDADYAAFGDGATGTKADGTTPWEFHTPLFWPSHDTHYHMRGVYPVSTVVTSNKVEVSNSTYNAATSPSNLMVGAPELAPNTMCDNAYHTPVDMSVHGICAREATINLNFRYMMSQVEVHLSTTSGSDAVELTDAVVEIMDGYTEGSLDIHSREITPKTAGNYTVMHADGENANYRHAAIVPQNLTNGVKNLQFRITITNADNTKDYYYATIKDVKVSENGSTPALISAWEPGKRYVYTLNMRKTEVKVTATIQDWITASGSTNIWM